MRASCEKVSISLCIFLFIGIWKFYRVLVVVVCMDPLILMVMMIGSRTVHPSWDRRGWRMAYFFQSSSCDNRGESITTMDEFKYLFFKIQARSEGMVLSGI